MRVFAAGSLRPAFERMAGEFTYANARDLAARIRAGEPADVFASASPEHPNALHADGLVDAPRAFAINRLVVAVREDSPARDFGVLEHARVVIEVEGVPLGDYTRELFARIGFVPSNIVHEEVIVDAVADRVISGDADAGVLYATDVAARPGRLRAIEVPRVEATYVAASITGEAARAWVEELFSPATQAILRDAGFSRPDRAS